MREQGVRKSRKRASKTHIRKPFMLFPWNLKKAMLELKAVR
jgi:hypothetical protein